VPTAILNPDKQNLSGGYEASSKLTPLYVLLSIALIAVAVAAAFLWLRFERLEQQMTLLREQVERTNDGLRKVQEASQAAVQRASQAETSAQHAAQERNEAEKAQAASEKNAELARQQTQTAQADLVLAQQKAEQFRKEREQELVRLQQALGQIADTRRTAMGLIMTLGSNSVRFDFDKATLRPENREVLSRIAGVLSTLKGYTIDVYGYADDIGSQEYNVKLSERRASAVRDYLVKSGLDPSIISTKGYGKSDPRAQGESANARAINRRVEIGIVDSRLRFEELPAQ
jgi:outer membrane protein OmpA-like peptidoglycan-associated protein